MGEWMDECHTLIYFLKMLNVIYLKLSYQLFYFAWKTNIPSASFNHKKIRKPFTDHTIRNQELEL